MRLSLLITSVLIVGAANAQTHAPHEHGKASLNVALSAAELSVELRAPADSFWGFEYVAKTPEQRAAEQKALATLKSGKWLVLPVSAGCKLNSSSAARSTNEAHDDEHGAHEAHEHEGHKSHDAHDHEKASDSKQASMHADVAVSLEYACSKPGDLMQEGAIAVGLFQIFPNISSVNLQAVTDSGQLAKTLSAASGAFGLAQER